MSKEVSQFRRKSVASTVTYEPKIEAAVLDLDSSLELHDVFAVLDPYTSPTIPLVGHWTAKGRLEFLLNGTVISTIRVDRSTYNGLSDVLDWDAQPERFLSQPSFRTPSGGSQPPMDFGSTLALTVAALRLRVKATQVRLFVESLNNNTGDTITFAVGLRVLSHKL